VVVRFVDIGGLFRHSFQWYLGNQL